MNQPSFDNFFISNTTHFFNGFESVSHHLSISGIDLVMNESFSDFDFLQLLENKSETSEDAQEKNSSQLKQNFLIDSTCASHTSPAKTPGPPTLKNSSNVLDEVVLNSFFNSVQPSILQNIEEVTSQKGSHKKNCKGLVNQRIKNPSSPKEEHKVVKNK